MKRFSSIAAAAVAVATLGACQQQTAQQLNTANANSQVYVGALTCNVSGSTGYIFGSTKDLSCIYLTKDGVAQAYDGKIRKFGIDIGYTKAVHTIWRVYSLGSDRAPTQIGGTYVGEQGTVAAGNQAGGNWIYGGPNAEIGMLASGVVKDAGYNLATGIAAMTIRLKQ